MEITLLEFGLVLILASVLGMLARAFKQPTILGYILAGMLVHLFIFTSATGDLLEVFAKLGIAFLLFLLGVELNVKEVKEVGPAALATGVGQVLITATVGFALGRIVFGFEMVEAVYVAIALTFSSTIVIVKLLGEKGDLTSLYGRISVGLLVVQDLIAVIALIVLNSLSGTGGGNLAGELLVIVITGLLLIVFALVVGRIIESLLEHMGNSTELILLTVIAWALVFAFLTQAVGFSLEVGAFIAGIVLSTSPLSVEITAKIKPLRDFFIIIFFIVLGMGLSVNGMVNNIVPIVVLSLFVLFGNPIILLSIMGSMGYHRRISFLTGLTVSQISEFSLIIVTTGVVLGQISPEILSIVTGVAIITLLVSSYFISHGDSLYLMLAGALKVFERSSLKRDKTSAASTQISVLVIGAHRMGGKIVDACKDADIPVVVVDYDPRTVRLLQQKGIEAVYGDLSDPELLDGFEIDKVKAVVSTVPTYEDNLMLLTKTGRNKRQIVIVRADSDAQAQELRDRGASYVLIPERVAGDKIVRILKEDGVLESKPKKRKKR
ncbi:cation:proton antiporter [candidate division WWE3 bacterium]|uniref:Cation:proton antiporter n=1 Tax=candidate division WWE3 bacterium TaxID=2053526 RepID=A0A955LLJ7_UNCKA|nr:cation:proton antiporter [candidate division WWE3 bacterium]